MQQYNKYAVIFRFFRYGTAFTFTNKNLYFIKLFRLFVTFLTVALCLTVMTSCSKDDDEPEKPLPSEKRLTTVSGDFVNWTLNYDAAGKLIKLMMTFDDYPESYDINIVYSGKTVTFDWAGEYKQVMQLNNDGFAESGYTEFEDYEHGSTYNWRFNCKYSIAGYLTEVTFPDSKALSGSAEDKISINYDANQNLKSASYQYFYASLDEYRSETYDFTPSSHTAKGKNYFILGDCFGRDEALDLFFPAFYAGILT